jgi:hypothetical protein
MIFFPLAAISGRPGCPCKPESVCKIEKELAGSFSQFELPNTFAI